MSAVLITGAGSGIGRAAALLFAQQGWACLLADISPAIERVRQECLHLGAADSQAFQVDLTKPGALAQLCSELPPLDALVNNAGISDISGIALETQSTDQLNRILSLNLEVPQRLFEGCLPILKAGARVVNVASGAGLKAIPWRGLYSPSKAGLIALTKGLAKAYPQFSLSVLCPGFVHTELVQNLIESRRLALSEAVSKIPMGRLASSEEMGAAILFLAGDKSRILSGQVLSVDGGSSIYGGSKSCVVCNVAPVSQNAVLNLQIVGSSEFCWNAVALPVAQVNGCYEAELNLSACDPLSCDSIVTAVLMAARRFKATHACTASLLVLLPDGDVHDWNYQTALATARMLVATLACEWAADALRINALVIAEHASVSALTPLIHFLSGPKAQFVTGQTLNTNNATEVCHGA